MAAAVDVQSLFLQVDASVELLRRNLAAGEQPLDRFEQRASKMAANVDKSIVGMGARFGEFAKLAESAADRAQKSFDSSFSQIQKMAAKAIAAPTVQGGGLNLGATEARQAAEAARQQAAALGLIENAARRAAQGEGVMTAETRLYLQAAAAARIEAERHATELMREAGALERLEIETRQAAAGQQLLLAGQRNGLVVTGQQRQSTMMLGQQFQDFFVQVSNGGNVMTAFSQQVGQAAFAVQGMGGRAEKVGAFLASGWGTAVIIGLTVLAPLVTKLMEGNDALDEAVAKLKKDAEQTVISDKAHAIFTQTLEGQIAAQKELNREMERGLVSQAQINRQNLEQSMSRQAKATQQLPRAEKDLVDAQRALDAVQASAPDGMSVSQSSAYASRLRAARQEVEARKDALALVKQELELAQRGVRAGIVTQAAAEARAAVDPIAAINKRYDDMADRARAAAASNDKLTGSIRGQLIEIEKQRVAALKVEQDRQSAEKRAESAARSGARSREQIFKDFETELSARGIQRASGRTGFRSAKDQNEIHRAGESPLDGYKRVSRHQSWQALDPTRASHSDQAAYEAAQAAGLKGFKIVTESGDRKHYEWSGAGKKGDVDAAGSESMTRRIEAAQNKVLGDQISFAEQERQARRRLLDAKRRTAESEEERDRLQREEIEADYSAQKTKIAAQLKRKDIKPEEAATLGRLNDDTRTQRLDNVRVARAMDRIAAGYDAEAQSADAKIAMLRIEGDMAITNAERRRIAAQLLELEQEQRRRALERQRDTSDDPNEVQRAKDGLAALPAIEGAERGQLAQRQAGPLEQYRQRLMTASGDMNEALDTVKANGLQDVEDGLTAIISGAESAGSAFKRMANSIIADLVRIAVQKMIVSAIGGSVGLFGLASGGKVEGKATGGKISGPGTGTSDSILAMLGSRPIMLSNGESIVTADATAKFWPVIDAMNKGRIKGYAGGGRVSPSIPAMPSAPRLPSMRAITSGGSLGAPVQHFHVNAQGAVLASGLVDEMRQVGMGATIGGSNMAQEAIAERQAQALV